MIPDEVREKWKMEFEEYSKHWPWYAKVSRGRRWQRFFCDFGMHIPVKSMPSESVCCQECFHDLTLEDWNKFWRGDR